MERSGLPGTVSCSVGRRTEYTPSLVALTGEGRVGGHPGPIYSSVGRGTGYTPSLVALTGEGGGAPLTYILLRREESRIHTKIIGLNM